MADSGETVHARPPPSDLPQEMFLDFDKPELNGEGEGEGEGERERAGSPQFSTTSTVSCEADQQTDDEALAEPVKGVRQTQANNGEDKITMDTTGVVATTTATWERFEPAPVQPQWEVFDQSGNGTVPETNGAIEGLSDGATAQSPGTATAGQSEDGTEATVCAADAMVSSGWRALGEEPGSLGDRDEEEEKNLPYRLTRSMRATTNRKVQIVDALKQQRRLSNTSLDRDPSRGRPFSNEDDLSRRYNVEREWQVFVKMNKRVPGTR